jgi:hypothetical protein
METTSVLKKIDREAAQWTSGRGQSLLIDKEEQNVSLGLSKITGTGYGMSDEMINLYQRANPKMSAGDGPCIEDDLKIIRKSGVQIPHPEEVREHLLIFQSLADKVVEACNRCLSHFSKSAQLSLEIYRDPELGFDSLKLYIRQTIYEPDILEQIDMLREPYLPLISNKVGSFHITTDFQSPK